MKANFSYLPSKVRKELQKEINRQTGENVRRLSVNIQALVLWYVHKKYKYGKKRLLDFQKDFLPMIEELQKFYESENADETEFACLYQLKNEVGIDVEQLDQMFSLQVRINQ